MSDGAQIWGRWKLIGRKMTIVFFLFYYFLCVNLRHFFVSFSLSLCWLNERERRRKDFNFLSYQSLVVWAGNSNLKRFFDFQKATGPSNDISPKKNEGGNCWKKRWQVASLPEMFLCVWYIYPPPLPPPPLNTIEVESIIILCRRRGSCRRWKPGSGLTRGEKKVHIKNRRVEKKGELKTWQFKEWSLRWMVYKRKLVLLRVICVATIFGFFLHTRKRVQKRENNKKKSFQFLNPDNTKKVSGFFFFLSSCRVSARRYNRSPSEYVL